MKKILFSLVIVCAIQAQAYAGEIRAKVPAEPLQRLTGCVGLLHRIFQKDAVPVKPDQQSITSIVDLVLPIVSHNRVPKLSSIPATCFVMKDEIIIQMSDEKLRGYMDDAFAWLHMDHVNSEQEKVTRVANYCLNLATRGLWSDLDDIPASVTVSFDDPRFS